MDTHVETYHFVVEYEDRTYSIKKGVSEDDVLNDFPDGFDLDRVAELHRFENRREAQAFADEEFEPHK